jgi:hypothetical protein
MFMENGQSPQITSMNEIEPPEFAAALRRAEAEFLEMPGLQLTEAQAARLWASDSALCHAVLTRLVETRFLVRTRNAGFARP